MVSPLGWASIGTQGASMLTGIAGGIAGRAAERKAKRRGRKYGKVALDKVADAEGWGDSLRSMIHDAAYAGLGQDAMGHQIDFYSRPGAGRLMDQMSGLWNETGSNDHYGTPWQSALRNMVMGQVRGAEGQALDTLNQQRAQAGYRGAAGQSALAGLFGQSGMARADAARKTGMAIEDKRYQMFSDAFGRRKGLAGLLAGIVSGQPRVQAQQPAAQGPNIWDSVSTALGGLGQTFASLSGGGKNPVRRYGRGGMVSNPMTGARFFDRG
jgi:hypothetical protein